jgi:hypothetical protein
VKSVATYMARVLGQRQLLQRAPRRRQVDAHAGNARLQLLLALVKQ